MDLASAIQHYETFDNLLDDVQTIAMAEGFALRIHRSVRRAPQNHECGQEYLRYDLSCVCAGKPAPERPHRKRGEQASLKTDCPFEIRGIWRVQKHCWELETIRPDHNHPPHEKPQDLCAHRRHLRRIDAAFELQVERLSRSGKMTASAIAKELKGLFDDKRGDGKMQITERDVENTQATLIMRKYGPFSSTQLFLEVLEQKENVSYHKIHRRDDHRIDSIFWTYSSCISRWKRSPEILSFDCTYKVNRFNLPLLQITGVTTLHTTYMAAYCLVSSEDEEGFVFPLQQLKILAEMEGIPMPRVILSDFSQAFKNAASRVVPDAQQQLCLWHVIKNVQHYARTHWNGPVEQDEPLDEDQEEAQHAEVNRILEGQDPPPSRDGERRFEDSPDGIVQA